MCLTFQTPQSEQKESIIKISRSEQTDRNQVMIGRSHSGDRAFMLLLVLRSFFPVPGNFIAPRPPVFWLLMSFSVAFSVKGYQWKSKSSTVGLWLEGPPPVVEATCDQDLHPPADSLTQRAAPLLLPHQLLHVQTCAGSDGHGKLAAQAVQESYLMRQTLRQAAGAPQPAS